MSEKSKERKQADAAFEAATSQSRETSPANEQPAVLDKTAKLKAQRLARDETDRSAAAKPLKRRRP